MKKILIDVASIDEHICGQCVYMDGTKLLTPSAKDMLLARGIRIVHGTAPAHEEPCTTQDCTVPVHSTSSVSFGSKETLLLKIAGFLHEEYGITDMQKLQTLSATVAKELYN